MPTFADFEDSLRTINIHPLRKHSHIIAEPSNNNSDISLCAVQFPMFNIINDLKTVGGQGVYP